MNRSADSAVHTAAGDTARPSPEPGVPDLDSVLSDAQRGDSEAFRVLYRSTQPRLLRYLRALVGDDAEDVASEAWLQVARDLQDFEGDHEGFRGWVVTIGRHRAIDHVRRYNRRLPATPMPVEELRGLAAADDTAASALEAVSTDAAVRLIATLPAAQAEAVLLRVVVGLDAESAAKVLGRRPGAVRTAAYRGLRTLARLLEQAGDTRAAGLDGTRAQLPRGRLEE
jgi:RNA polymerase sigma-70 factor (ECF subfamily)